MAIDKRSAAVLAELEEAARDPIGDMLPPRGRREMIARVHEAMACSTLLPASSGAAALQAISASARDVDQVVLARVQREIASRMVDGDEELIGAYIANAAIQQYQMGNYIIQGTISHAAAQVASRLFRDSTHTLEALQRQARANRRARYEAAIDVEQYQQVQHGLRA